MKKFYSIVLMAAALLVGTNAWATTQEDIQAVFTAGGDIQLTSNVTVTSPLQMYAKKAETGKTVNLDLNGFTISNSGSPKALIELYKGTLNITGPGRIATTAKSEAIKVFGYTEDVADWSVLNIGEGVSVESTGASGANAISVLGFYGSAVKYYAYVSKDYANQVFDGEDGRPQGNESTLKGAAYVKSGAKKTCTSLSTSSSNALYTSDKIDYFTSYPKASAVKSGTVNSETIEWCAVSEDSKAFGVKINVMAGAFVYGDKYGIKINGTIRSNGTNIPTVHIANGAEVKAAAEAPEATAVYSSGYGKFVIEGYVHGSTGVYVKAGQVSVEDGAKIQSDNNTGDGIEAINKGSGINAGGNAIAIEGDNGAYSNEGISVEVNGGTIIAGEGGYAVQNLNNAETQANPNAVEINGGTFTGGAAGSVAIDNKSGKVVNVDLEGGTSTGDIETLIAAAGAEKVISEVVSVDAAGNATVVIGKKEAGDEVEQPATPKEKEEFVFVNNMSNDIVKLDATTAPIAKTLPAGTTEVKYLSLTGTGSYTTTVTVEEGKTLKVGQIVMNANGRIIVKAGGKLIVSGANGIFADNIENLVLETEEGNHSSFLLHPNVANNQHPKATVQFVSKAYYKSSSDFVNQRFGIPTIGALESITAEAGGNPIATQIWGYFNGSWAEIGFLGASFDPSKMNQPFAYYQMANDNPNRGTVVTMTGNLVGIADPELNLTADGWSTFANSYMGNLTGSAMLDMFDGHNDVDMTIRSYVPTSASTFIWQSFNFANILFDEEIYIAPMQAFIIKNNGAADQLQMSYKNMVWNPMFPDNKVLAPRRVAASSDLTTARVEVRNAAGAYDYVSLLAGDQFSAEYNNGYDAEKIMNNTLDLYTVGAMNQATLATDNLNNTVLGLNCVEAGTYTISFSHINGEELILIDHVTGARVAMVEGNTYDFTVSENTENDYRFEIVESAKLPTAIENTEAVKSAKGVYTITGQYVGEMNVWNTLPAGIYVVNGEKRVK